MNTRNLLTIAAAISLTGSAAWAGDSLTLDGSTTVGPIAKAFAEYFMDKHKDVTITVSESGSGNGAKGLINGTCDIGCMSRFMKEKEVAAAVAKGILPVPHVVAMDGLPILVHPSNPIKNLTVEQVRKVFEGTINNWKALGGPDRPIVVVSRDTNSGTYETFYKLVMTHQLDGEKIKTKIGSSAEYVGSNGAVRSRVQSTPNAIGYAGLGFVDRTVKALTVNDVEPNADTVASGLYPIARPLFMFTHGYPKLGSTLFRFITIYLTPEGQEMVEEIGFVPVTKY